jgi:hypothetical protein
MLVPGLYQFFRRQLQHGFRERGLTEQATVDYVSDVLTRFSHVGALNLIRDADGAPVETIAGLVGEWQRAQGWDDNRANRPREALIVRHIGEFTLFMSGFFQQRLRARGQLAYYISQGRGAFWQCASHAHNPGQAQVFRRLYGNFDRIAGALDHIYHHQLPLTASTAADPSPLTALWRA